MASVVQGVVEVEKLIGIVPVIVDRLTEPAPHLELLRSADGVTPAEPAAAFVPTVFGDVKVDLLEVRQIELDDPSDDPGDRLHASPHAWAHDSASALHIMALRANGSHVAATALVADPGPLIAMKLQAVMDRDERKKGTDLLDIIRLVLDKEAGPQARNQVADVEMTTARDIETHVDLWFRQRQVEVLRLVKSVGGDDFTLDDLAWVGELISESVRR